MAMETQDQELVVKAIWRDASTWTALWVGVYLAVLPMANTIALRNVALVALLMLTAWRFSSIRREVRLGPFVVLWALYLVVFPFTADDHHTAWISLGGQWGRGLLAMLAGAGAAVILRGRRTGDVFYIGLVSAAPLLVHLALFSYRAAETHAVPWGYWGRETHHADLGYAAGHVVVLMTACLLAGDGRYWRWAIGLIAAALFSTVLAQSRAGLAFAVLGGACVFGVFYLRNAPPIKLPVLVLVLVSVGGLAGLAMKGDVRWHTLSAKLSAGLLGDAIQIECQGTASIEADILSEYGTGATASQLIDAVRDGDGARVVLLRAGLELALKNPMGSDGSRQAFQNLLRQECPSPAIVMAHAHNGWIDTMLAIGMAGAALYLAVLLHFGRRGYVLIKRDGCRNQWALVLMVLSAFWIVRGFTDSVFRDHMLEMQGFVLAFALVASQNFADRSNE
jgi:O-antigen ligase